MKQIYDLLIKEIDQLEITIEKLADKRDTYEQKAYQLGCQHRSLVSYLEELKRDCDRLLFSDLTPLPVDTRKETVNRRLKGGEW